MPSIYYRSNSYVVCALFLKKEWKQKALRQVPNADEGTKAAFKIAHTIVSTAPPGTTVTGLIDVSGMLIIRGEGDGNGKLSFEGMKLGGGFQADSGSRIEVDMSFQVIMGWCDRRARVRLLLDSARARSLLGAAACGARCL